MVDLRALVEAKSGAPPVSCGPDDLRLRLGHNVASMHASGFDAHIVAEHETFNQQLEPFLVHVRFGQYLASLTPQQVYQASGVRVLPLDAIREEIQQLAPGARIFPHGYLPFATSIGGNAICFHARTGGIVWVDHDTFSTDEIIYKDTATGTYRTVPFTPEHIHQAVILIAHDFEEFLVDLLQDRLTEQLEKFD
jgi:hypothetical protein